MEKNETTLGVFDYMDILMTEGAMMDYLNCKILLSELSVDYLYSEDDDVDYVGRMEDVEAQIYEHVSELGVEKTDKLWADYLEIKKSRQANIFSGDLYKPSVENRQEKQIGKLENQQQEDIDIVLSQYR